MASSTHENQFAVIATKLLKISVISMVLCVSSAICAQAQDAQPNKSDESWTASTESSAENTNPKRTTESHAKTSNGIVDKQTVEVLGPDGHYQPQSDTEKETIRVNATTTRTVERTYIWDGNGQRKLERVTEEEARNSPSGGAQVIRTTSNSDVNGDLQVAQREVADTKNAGPQAQETKTTFYLADGNGGFTASRQTQELQTRSADHTVEVKKTTLAPDGNGNWEVGEVTEKTIKEEGKKRITEEQVSHPDSEGKLLKSSRTVGEETETSTGEKSNTVDTYSTAVPGVAGDGGLHLNKRVATAEKKDSGGSTIEQQVEQPDPNNPNADLQANAKTKYTVHYAAPGTQETKTVEVRDGSGNFNVISVETRKSDQVPPAQPPTAPSDKPK